MIKTIGKIIKHKINLVRHAFRDAGIKSKRSPEWHKVEKEFLSNHSTCAACGGTDKLNVHHCMPFHLDPKLELDVNNLITLCMGEKECHVLIWHGDNFRCYNADVREDAAKVLANPALYDEVVKEAKLKRKK